MTIRWRTIISAALFNSMHLKRMAALNKYASNHAMRRVRPRNATSTRQPVLAAMVPICSQLVCFDAVREDDDASSRFRHFAADGYGLQYGSRRYAPSYRDAECVRCARTSRQSRRPHTMN